MAQITIEIPDDIVSLVGDAFVDEFPDTYEGDPADSAAKIEFARDKLIEVIEIRVRDYQTRQAQAAAVQNVPETPLNLT